MSAFSELEIGSVVDGTVSGITNFGAFIALPNGKTGLVHISEVADEFVRDVRDFLKEEDPVRVKVLSLDDRGRIALSIKQADPSFRRSPVRPAGRRGGPQSFEDKLSKFLKESEDRMTDLRRIEGKRGGRGGRSL